MDVDPPLALLAGGLVVRRADPEDAPAVVEAINASLDHLRPRMAWAARAANEPDTVLRLAISASAMDAGGDGAWIMVDGEHVVGGCGLHDRIGPGVRDIGYWVRAGWTGRGIATRAAAALTWAGFECYGLDRVEIRCDASNEPSAAVARRLGFRHRETREEQRDGPADTGRTMVWELDRATWPATPAAGVAVRRVDRRR